MSDMLRLLLFIAINFGALAIGSLLMGNIAENQWYDAQQKAPWTPPGWVFGAAWFSIMACLSWFMFKISGTQSFTALKPFYWIFALQFVLNVLWNPVFFRWHYPLAGLFIIAALTIVVIYMFIWARNNHGWLSALLLPYCIWLLIATSLNAYVVVKN